MLADHFDGALPHLGARDVSLAAISRAPLAEIQAFQKRMGWGFRWLSSSGNEFNYDFRVSFRPEQRKAGKVAYNWLDIAPKGRDEEGLPHTMSWVRHHDKYE